MSDLGQTLRRELGVAVSSSGPDKICYARDLWPRQQIEVRAGRVAPHPPAAVTWPESTEQVAAVVAFCAREGIEVVPYGAGSGVCGGVQPTDRTLVIDLKRMSRCRRVAPEEGYVEAEAGVQGIRLEEDLAPRGLTVGHYPSSILCSTVGGWIAARGAGQCSGLYGKIEDMTAAIECVDGRGQVVTLERRTQGPDLTPLIVGSEGTLAVITAARLRLHAAAEQRSFAAVSFATMEGGYEAIRAIYQAGLRPAVCRLYDPFDTMMARHGERKTHTAAPSPLAHRDQNISWIHSLATRQALRFPATLNAAIDALGGRAFGGAMLVLVWEGSADRAEAERAEALRLATDAGATDLGEGPARHWLGRRYSVSYRQAPVLMMGAFVDTMEVAAPWSRLGSLYDSVRRALGRRVLVMAHMSHAYPDGCSIYFTFAGSARNDEQALASYDAAWRDASAAAIEAGGTLSHHHGVGRSKAPRMGDELGLGIEMVAALRGAFDPAQILNPGNLMPATYPPRAGLPAAPRAPRLDATSRTVSVSGKHTLAQVDATLAGHGLSLGLTAAAPDGATTVDAWLAAGAPGAPDPWLDPVDHLVAGYSAVLPSGAVLRIRPCPRRAVGPDLLSLFFGHGGRCGQIHTAHLRARGRGAAPLDTPLERNPPVGAREQEWIDRTVDTIGALR